MRQLGGGLQGDDRLVFLGSLPTGKHLQRAPTETDLALEDYGSRLAIDPDRILFAEPPCLRSRRRTLSRAALGGRLGGLLGDRRVLPHRAFASQHPESGEPPACPQRCIGNLCRQ